MFESKELVEYVVQKIYELIPGSKHKTSVGINFACPICGDSKTSKKKKRGWFFTSSGMYHCYNGGCEVHLSALKFLSALEHKDIKEVKKDVLIFYKNNVGVFNNLMALFKSGSDAHTAQSKPEDPPKFIQQSIDIPDDWIDIEKHDQAFKIVESRKIMQAPFIPKNWKLYFDTYSNRIVIPWIRNSHMVYYQKRSIYKNDTNKYLFPANTEKDIFGLDNLDQSFPYIFMLEGVFDSIWVKNGIAIGGISLTEHQQKLLEEFKLNYTFVYMFDNQNIDHSARDNYLKLAKDKHNLFIWDKSIKYKDVNEYVLATENNPFSDKTYLMSRVFSGLKALVQLKF